MGRRVALASNALSRCHEGGCACCARAYVMRFGKRCKAGRVHPVSLSLSLSLSFLPSPLALHPTHYTSVPPGTGGNFTVAVRRGERREEFHVNAFSDFFWLNNKQRKCQQPAVSIKSKMFSFVSQIVLAY
jgi:hypothetical protein